MSDGLSMSVAGSGIKFGIEKLLFFYGEQILQLSTFTKSPAQLGHYDFHGVLTDHHRTDSIKTCF